MRAVIQRTDHASVEINNSETRTINKGLVVLIGITHDDTVADAEWLCSKITRLRIFPDDNDVMNRSLEEIEGEILLISQFTLHASTKKGNRPSYMNAARPEQALPLYEKCIGIFESLLGKKIITGEFGADMKVSLINNGPVTILIDSKNPE